MDLSMVCCGDGSFFSTWGTLIKVVSYLVGGFLLRWILLVVIRNTVDQIVSGVKKRQNVDDTQSIQASPLTAVRVVQRTRTLGSVLSNITTVVIVIIVLALVVNAVDDSILSSLALLTAALGAGLGFGAQNIVKDILNGLFMVVEDQLGVGDVVDVGPATGVVETVGIRITTLRDVNGTLWFVRNGEILRVGNMSQGWARVVIDLAVPYDTDVQAVQERMLATATELASTPKWRSRIVEKPELWGIESISESAVVIRVVVKTRSNARDDVSRELRGRLKASLDAMGVTLPSLTAVVLTGFDSAASVGGAHPPRTASTPVQQPEQPAPRKRAARKVAQRQPGSPAAGPASPVVRGAAGSRPDPRATQMIPAQDPAPARDTDPDEDEVTATWTVLPEDPTAEPSPEEATGTSTASEAAAPPKPPRAPRQPRRPATPPEES
ncbi:mechanosensitive ion channel family protein [Clavibacter nebraskensis]|uniref:Mechanosensitive ion channel n=2 Tax=Clavibacter nebraskensis TaxID=31963 RepID=A0AAI9EKC2_9MICO|nr:mechanosensitive ion channel domain-containing protein [Clavibacter nebraskensis]KXU20623.1 mechanosensitive ion channel protein [Clavibacter nebraskensis]OAH22159.1 mechanosensitive ion channel protein [Clavibacter nebraskensis]QGV66606.1 mechanosensitive ion channel [Clavibacter nebraskensis]QGV69405.1 mechanosensitive ion channel [Clavibacter nebraskensis]QGV72195.1 mechanosensitive ion channel [Clavibacter nebraskensis]